MTKTIQHTIPQQSAAKKPFFAPCIEGVQLVMAEEKPEVLESIRILLIQEGFKVNVLKEHRAEAVLSHLKNFSNQNSRHLDGLETLRFIRNQADKHTTIHIINKVAQPQLPAFTIVHKATA